MSIFRAHGANPEKLCQECGLPLPPRLYDFSTNTNAVPQREGFLPDLKAALEDYPDDDCAELTSFIASRRGRKEKEIFVSAGSNEAIYLLSSLLAEAPNYIYEPVYGEYRRALAAYGAAAESIHSLNSELPAGSALWLCNPCNPTGKFIADSELDSLIESHPQTLFIVDEAYRGFIWKQRPDGPGRAHPNLIRLHSLTKLYNLCGARIAYLEAPEAITARLRARRPGWSVSGLAQQAALYFMRDESLPARTAHYYAAEIPRLREALAAEGFETEESCVNFFLLKTEDDEKLLRFMLQRGIVLRHTRNFQGLDGRYVRIAARTKEEDNLLIAAFREYAQKRTKE